MIFKDGLKIGGMDVERLFKVEKRVEQLHAALEKTVFAIEASLKENNALFEKVESLETEIEGLKEALSITIDAIDKG